MNGVMFDTHRMVKQLVAVGFTDAQAESVTEVVSAARAFDLDNLATKADLATLATELRQEIAATKAELRQEIAATKAELRQEIAATKAELRQEIALLRSEMIAGQADLRVAIAESRAEILRWVIGLAVAQTGLMFALLKLVPGH